MADTKISQMSALASPTDDDLVPVVDSPGSTPTNKSLTFAAIKTWIRSWILTSDVTEVTNKKYVTDAQRLFLSQNDAIVVVQSASTDVARGANLLTAYTAAQALTPNGLALSATNRATVLVTAGNYDISPASVGSVGLTLSSEFVDFVGEGQPFIYRKARSSTDNGISIEQTAIDVRLTDVNLGIQQFGSGTTSACEGRAFVQTSKTIASGSTGTFLYYGVDGDGNLIATDFDGTGTAGGSLILRLQKAGETFVTKGVASGDYVRITGIVGFTGFNDGYNSEAMVRSFKVATTQDMFNAGLGSTNPISNTILYLVKEVNQAIAPTIASNASGNATTYAVHRTQAPSQYTRLKFFRYDSNGVVDPALGASIATDLANRGSTYNSLFGSPWGSIHLDGTWTDCDASKYKLAFRVNSYGHMLGTFIRCFTGKSTTSGNGSAGASGNDSFGGDGTTQGTVGTDPTAYAWFEAICQNCEAGNFSFGSCSSFGEYGTSAALLIDCIAGQNSVCKGKAFFGKVRGGRYGYGSIGCFNNWASTGHKGGRFGGIASNFVSVANIVGVPTKVDIQLPGCGFDVVSSTYGQSDGKVQAVSIAQEAQITTTDNTATNAIRIHLANNSLMFISARAVAKRTDTGTENAFFERRWSVRLYSNGSATVTEIGTGIASRNTLSTADLTLVYSSNYLFVQVTGETNKTIDWVVDNVQISLRGT